MKIKVILLTALFFGTHFVFSNVILPPDEAGDVKWDMKTYDFGKVKKDEPASVYFTFTNSGEAPALITSVKSSCGCTATEYPTEGVNPGKHGKIKVTYNSKKTGMFSKTVRVFFQGSEQAVILTIKGEVVVPAEN